MRRAREIRRLRERAAAVKVENDRVFFAALDNAPSRLRGKARLRWALEVLKVGDDYQEEKALRLRIAVLEGHVRLNADRRTYTVLA